MFDLKKRLRGQASVETITLIVLTFIIGTIFIFNVALPVINTGIAGNATAGNITGYAGAYGIGQASYVLTVLAVVAIAAFMVLSFFKVGGL